MKQTKKWLRHGALPLWAAALALSLAACGSDKADKPVDDNTCGGQPLPEGKTSCDCVHDHWQNCLPADGDPDAGPGPGPADNCDPAQMPEWAVACDCTTEGWLNCRADSDCSTEEIAACEAQNLQCRSGGECYDARCEGVTCDPGQTCKHGDCVFDACVNVSCTPPKVCNAQGNCISETGANILFELEGGNDIVDDNGTTKVTVNVRLDSAPAEDVRVVPSFTGQARNEVQIETEEGGDAALIFTADNWETPQPLTIAGTNDEVVDGDKTVTLNLESFSADSAFSGLTQTIPLVNRDTETASVILKLPDVLETTEDGGSVQIGLKLGGRPSAAVTIPLSVSNDAYASVTPPTGLTIQPEDWDKEQTITVTGKNDGAVVNTTPHTYQLILGEPVTTDALFAAMEMPTVDLVNSDNDAPQLMLTKTQFTVSESGGTDHIGVYLSTEPTAETTITATVSPATRCKITDGATLTFNAGDYGDQKDIAIEGLEDDGTADGDHDCTLVLTARSSDNNSSTTYNGMTRTVYGTIKDNDKVGLVQRSLIDSSNLSEAGLNTDGDPRFPESGKICYSLSSRPTKDVRLNISSSNTSTGATVSPSSLTFQPAKYNTEQCVIVTATDDGIVDSTNSVQVRAESTSNDNDYSGRFLSYYVNVYNRNSTRIMTDMLGTSRIQEGASASFRFKLGSKPSANVTVALTTLDQSELSISSSTSVSISPANWDTWQTGTIQGVRDSAYDGNVSAGISLTASSRDSDYDGMNKRLYYIVEDIDSPGISMNCTSNSYTYANCSASDYVTGTSVTALSSEKKLQGSLTCKVKLTKQPTSDVTVQVQTAQSNNNGTGGFSNAAGDTVYNKGWRTLTFTRSNYSTEQEVVFYYTGTPPGATYDGKPYKAYDSFTVTAFSKTSSYPAPDVKSSKFSKYNICRYFYFSYRNQARSIDLPAGTYLLRAWGASGGQASYKAMALNSNGTGFKCTNHGGAGAYMEGILKLDARNTLYVRTGQAGLRPGNPSSESDRAYNGGGIGRGGGDDRKGGGGGGGTDFCLSPGSSSCSSDSTHWPYRILVAGGGGGGPDPTHSCYSSDYDFGADALKASSSAYATSYGGTHDNSMVYTSNGARLYYAQSGSRNGVYTSRSDYGNRFGTGMSVSDCSDSSDGYRRAGGGGGWYGGLAYCGSTKTVGGGAGSSYAFEGTRHGSGQQSYSYPLTNVTGVDGGYTSVPYEEIGSDGKAYWGTRFGNVGDGYAIIEVQQ